MALPFQFSYTSDLYNKIEEILGSAFSMITFRISVGSKYLSKEHNIVIQICQINHILILFALDFQVMVKTTIPI